MSFTGLLVNTVSRERRTTTNTRGQPTVTWGTAVTGIKCSIQYMGSGGFGVGGMGSIQPLMQGLEVLEVWWGIFEYGASVAKGDRITDERSRVFMVKSDPQDMTGRRHHQECMLAIVEE